MMSYRSVGHLTELDKLAPQAQIKGPAPDRSKQASEFKKELSISFGKLESLKFSNHALGRLADREVVLTPDRAERLVKAVDAVEQKGAKESLVLLDELAFVVSVKNRTVITACPMGGLKEGVFTKIDSAIFG
jgi:flagellar operon protein